jgi:hypothetical protein
LAVLAENGICISGTPIADSRTSSVILFGKEDQSENTRGKKRVEKNCDKLEKESAKSGGSHHSKASRSTNGRYEGGTTFNNRLFVKAGMSNGGNQQWKCASCWKKTVAPINHLCV